MRHERAAHTLQASALVNEVYLRLIDADQVQWQDGRAFSELRGCAWRIAKISLNSVVFELLMRSMNQLTYQCRSKPRLESL